MTDTLTGRIPAGAAVECTDGRLGTFAGVEHDASGGPGFIKVTQGWGGEQLLIPFDLIERVREDGSVQLACARSDIEIEREDSAGQVPSGISGEDLGEEAELERTIELKEEELVAEKEMREVGRVEVRTEVEEVPGRLEVEAYREEVEVEHVPVGQVVSEKTGPWEEDGVLIVPVYEEQLVVTKRLLLREQLRIRRVATTETQLFEDTVRRERLVIEDPNDSGLVHERFPTGDEASESERRRSERDRHEEGGFLEKAVRKAFE